jgi:hypothetical protein
LGKLSLWADESAPQLATLWLNGMAGTGKSAIANTFAKKIDDEGLLGAIFSVDRQLAERRDPHRIVQSLAYQLAEQDSDRLHALWSSLCAEPTIMNVIDDSSLKKQVRALIKTPLDVACSESLMILIDGLDECTPSDGVRLLSTLVDCLSHLPIKLFVASRRDQDIIDCFGLIPHTDICIRDQPIEEVSKDVQLYWEDNLDKLCRDRRLPDWRSTVDVDVLVELTGTLFIYATTMLMIVRNTMGSPIEKLRDLLKISHSRTGSAIAFAGLGKRYPLENLYMHILAEAIKDYDGDISSEYAARLHDILEVVIFAREPLTALALSELLNIDGITLKYCLTTLSPVLVIPDSTDANDLIRPMHQSFPDFVILQGKHVHQDLVMDPIVADLHVTNHCLAVLIKELRFNICGIQDPSLFNDEVPSLEARIRGFISAALRYACRFWFVHWLEYIRIARAQSCVPSGLDKFCKDHLLHWIESLSLTKALDEVRRVMYKLLAEMEVGLAFLVHANEKLMHICSRAKII